jgi:ArsR family transcriptional regulator, arsenate/arsenite/antimonite-responsive transcriptional repressor
MADPATSSPRRKLPAGGRRPAAAPAVDATRAQRVAALAKALGDPVRVQLLDVLRASGEPRCPCELLPAFDVAQPTLAHHLKVLRDAGIVDCHKQGLFAYYELVPGALEDLARVTQAQETA